MRTTAALRLFAVATCSVLVSGEAEAQSSLRRLRTLGEQHGDAGLYRVRAAAFNGSDLVVLSEGSPALHLFEGTRHRSFGARGRGPAELTAPQNAVWAGGRILVRDSELRKIASYDRAGNFVGSRPLTAGMAVRLEMAGRDTLVELFGQQTQTVVRLRGARQDTVLRYAHAGDMVQLSAPGAPSLTIPAPYAGGPAWAALPNGRIAFWDGRESVVRLLDLTGRVVGRLPLPASRYAVTAPDREAWFASAIPSEIRGQRVFEPLRQRARTEVRFPGHFPAVLGLRADPSGGVWVQQTPSASGQRWVLLREGQAPARIQLPPRQTLLAIGEHELAALARDADDVEVIHVYGHPQRTTARR